jgi:hypothetical protein
MAFNFAGGVRDPDCRRGFVAVSAGSVVAVDLADGKVVWRRDRIGRPVAATGDRLVTLDREGRSFALRLLDAATGADAGAVKGFGMPDWADAAGLDADAVDLEATETPTGIRISWRVRRPYRGGAPPPARLAAQTQEKDRGEVILDPRSGEVTSAASSVAEPMEAAPRTGVAARSSTDPDIVALEPVGSRTFSLKVDRSPGQPRGVTLEAHDTQSGSKLWETPLAQLSENAAKPGPLRPATPKQPTR